MTGKPLCGNGDGREVHARGICHTCYMRELRSGQLDALEEHAPPVSPVFEIPEWTEQAHCAEVDPDLFFPIRGASSTAAKRICGGCEVRDDCLEWAIEHREPHGI